ncbi:DUF4136 domain-containing protein [Chitinibacter bivalviorum]|uniref:DUF4136 domain-containing protein n=1 Tax=Chitinibacter bivalviorum TaxID=2739434 RepID=A0A7H9BDX3_9NEIS|nr:DUF4136 domain-containing protein [Chitinibacter bivalviorum]QLG86819.1 DUF4136 domain-containing protein [Chitinibacter bivalviorum]
MSARWLLAVFALAILAGCASPTFVSTVSVRHQLPAGVLKASAPAASGAAAVQAAMARAKSFAIERTASQAQSLAYQEFETELAQHLVEQGLVWQHDPKLADWLVRFDYQIDDGKNKSYQQPIWGTVGYSVSYQRVIRGGSVIFIPRYYPETGIIGTQTVNETIFTREVFVDILDRKTLDKDQFAKLYEGRARNRSHHDELESAVPWLIRSLFLPFPGPSGVSREVRIPLATPKP